MNRDQSLTLSVQRRQLVSGSRAPLRTSLRRAVSFPVCGWAVGSLCPARRLSSSSRAKVLARLRHRARLRDDSLAGLVRRAR